MESMYPLTPLPAAEDFKQTGSISEQYQKRRDALFAYTDTTRDQSYFIAAAKLVRRADVEAGLDMIEEMLADPSDSSRGMFVIYELMAAYLYGREVMPLSLRNRIWESFKSRPLYRGDTENHWVMYYTGLYLAAQTWPNYSGEYWYTGKSSSENFKEAESFLNYWIETTTTIGQGEFDSPTYHIVYLAPMAVLLQFAKDPAMKKNAESMMHYLLADFAVEHLNGMYCGAHSRDYPFDAVEPKRAPMTAWAWLFFGQTSPVMRQGIIAAALSDYKMPDIIYQIATDRSQPYVHTETKRVRNIIRFSDERNPPVYKYTFMTRDFALGSMQGGILQPIQEHTWDVTFLSQGKNSTVFTIHPYISGRELGMFFPEEMKFTVDEVARFHTYYGKEDKWVSSSPYEQIFQHKNVLIALYDIPEGTEFEHIDGFFPKDLDQRISQPFTGGGPDSSHWIFCRTGNTYIAYLPLKPYDWIEEDICWRLRSHSLKNGLIVEVAAAQEYDSFEHFQETIRSNELKAENFDQKMQIEYVSSKGDHMQFSYDGDRILNGTPIDFNSYKLFNGPFLNAEVGSGKLEMKYKEMRLELDFSMIVKQ